MKVTGFGNRDLYHQAEFPKNSTANLETEIKREGVVLELSIDGKLKADIDKIKAQAAEWHERIAEEVQRKQKLFEESGGVKHRAPRMIIPHIQTNDALVNSLEGLEENLIDAVYRIISDDLLTTQASSSPEARNEQIALGLGKAKYLAVNYMSADQADKFMKVMEQIAKFGITGKADQNGIIRYDIPRGPLVGAPDDYVNVFSVMKKYDPQAWATYTSLMEDAVQTNDIEQMLPALRYALEWSRRMHVSSARIFQQEAKTYQQWKQSVDNISLPEYDIVDYLDIK